MPGATTERSRVLYVEDDDDLWRLVHRRLSPTFSLVRAASDVEACVLLREFWGELKAVVTDLNLAGSHLSGVDLIRLIRGTLPGDRTPAWALKVPTSTRLPIIVTTGSEAHVGAATAAGATLVLMKPFSFEALQAPLRAAVGPRPLVTSALVRPATSAGNQERPAKE
ncbi:MAG: response regulator [Myxococcaceae bacterium]|nr:response regulator [Myxococcaceae bacterium]